MSKERVQIPQELRRKLFVDSGHQCSVPFCFEKPNLVIHHINGDPSDNKESNLIILCPNHHALADRNKIDRKECRAYKERLKQVIQHQPNTETLKDKLDKEGIDVTPESPLVNFTLKLGRKYMMWRYGKPDSTIGREIIALSIVTLLCFLPIFYTTLVMRNQVNTQALYFSMFFLILGCILLIILSVIVRRKCDNCNGYFGIERIRSQKIDEREIVRTEEKIKMEKRYRNTYRCIYCGNEYEKNEAETEIISLRK